MNVSDYKESPNYMTVSEAAIYCNVHKNTVQRWTRISGLEHVVLKRGKGTIKFINKSVLLDYIAAFDNANITD